MANFLVVAASSSIGCSVTKELKEAGHNVFTTARDNTKIIPDYYLDATDFNAVENIFVKIGQLDGVVNCSGSLFIMPAHLTSKEQYQNVIDASLTTSFAIVRAAGKFMTSGGSVVLISSAAATEGFANHESISAAKAGIIGLTLASAATYAKMNLRVNAIAPGLVDSNLTKNIIENETSRKFSESMHALGRIGTPQDIARAIVFMLDPDNSWITGQVLGVDGGLSSIRPKMRF